MKMIGGTVRFNVGLTTVGLVTVIPTIVAIVTETCQWHTRSSLTLELGGRT